MSLASILSDRHNLLQILLENDRTKNELEEVLSCSRSTIDRAIRELDGVGLIEYQDGRWGTTVLGECAFKRYDTYRRELDCLASAAPLVDTLPADSAVGREFIEGAEAHSADAPVPDAITVTLFELIQGTDRVELASPFLGVGFLSRVHNRPKSADRCRLELTLADDVVEWLGAAHSGLMESLLTDETINLWRSAIPFGFGVWVAPSDHAGVIVVGDHGIAGLLVNDSPTAISWAKHQLERLNGDPIQQAPTT